jgi:hypothetical protein
MRAACSNSGNVKENKSLYWHPSIYRFDKSTGLYHIETPVFATAYYIWRDHGDGVTKAFPDGFQMIARQGHGAKTRAEFNCAGSDDLKNVCNPSERDGGDCTPIHTCGDPIKGDGDSYAYECFPPVQCSELEIKIVFPACSNGKKTSADHMSHVAYAEGNWTSQEEAFNAECPSTHPIRIPEVQMYFRLYNYQGGPYTFSDGTSTIHTDYFSGWDEAELQKALDGCSKDKDNGSNSAQPDKWCEEFFTFRDAPKKKKSDELIIEGLKKIQPTPTMDLQKTVSAEKITGVSEIPTGACTGELIESDPNDWKSVKCGEDSGLNLASSPSASSGWSRNTNSWRVVEIAAAVAIFFGVASDWLSVA